MALQRILYECETVPLQTIVNWLFVLQGCDIPDIANAMDCKHVAEQNNLAALRIEA